MPYIAREDGEKFIIPSYRDVLTVAQKSQLKKDILLLSQSYGEFIALQRKGQTQYEVAFSTDPGYLLGETVWHHFNKPQDLIYCEAIANTTEAILVIVKSGSVYLDGSFPIDSIPEELIIFLTQQNNFEIYVHGEVPLSKTPETGKFSFEASSVKSFNVLTHPVFQSLPLLKTYQLQLVEPVLKAQGIGVFPIRPLITLLVLLGLIIGGISWFIARQTAPPEIPVEQINPYQSYYDALTTPAPDAMLRQFLAKLSNFYQMPGWNFTTSKYQNGTMTTNVVSKGGKVADLYAWSDANHLKVVILPDGLYLIDEFKTTKRQPPNAITPLDQIIGLLVDKIAVIYPGNNLDLDPIQRKDVYNQVVIVIKLSNIPPDQLNLIAEELSNLPLNLQSIEVQNEVNGNLTGTITIEALGK